MIKENSGPLMEPEKSLPCSKNLVTEPYRKHIKFRPNPQPCFLKGQINITLPSVPRSIKLAFHSRFKLKFLIHFSNLPLGACPAHHICLDLIPLTLIAEQH